jgi:hypothetical protein
MSKNLHSQPNRAPVPMALIPTGANSFTLQLISLNGQTSSPSNPRQAPRPAA